MEEDNISSDEDFFTGVKVKAKSTKKDLEITSNTWKGMATAFCNITSLAPWMSSTSQLPIAYFQTIPTLTQHPALLQEDKLQRKNERSKKKNANRKSRSVAKRQIVAPSQLKNPNELKLRRLAATGVVKLVNAMMQSRRETYQQELDKAKEMSVAKRRRMAAIAANRGEV
eukprot:Lankesteria_metandrocarpae@DN270_c0_g1_i1.p1